MNNHRSLIPKIFLLGLASVASARATTLNVPGTYTTIGAALNAAQASDIIQVAAGTYNERLTIAKSVTIQGAGAGLTTINGQATDTVITTLPGYSVVLDDLTITNGIATAPTYTGGGVFNEASLRMERCVVTGNGAASEGAGIANINGDMIMVDCTVSTNIASDAGAGIENEANLTMTNCTIANNAAGTLFVGNTGIGGGISNTGNITATNVTIVGNSAVQGGGIYAGDGSVALSYCTVFKNTADQSGGGVTGLAVLTAASTIIAGNTCATAPDVDGELSSQGYNLIGNNKDSSIVTLAGAGGDQIGTNTAIIDPKLQGSLTNNGGPTQTVVPQTGSPAIDHGNPGSYPSTDQRGIGRPQDGDVNGSVVPDVGAVEVQAVYVVTNANDVAPGQTGFAGSFRAALTASNTGVDGIIKFAIPGSGVHTINMLPAAGLSILTKVFIDGWSQGGTNYTGPPLIEINGSALTGASVGLTVSTSNVVIRGLAINRFPRNGSYGYGILVNGGAGAWIYGCNLGTDATGLLPLPNAFAGIVLSSGGTLLGSNGDGVNDAAERNIISANSLYGVYVNSSGNTIRGNVVGEDANNANPNGNMGNVGTGLAMAVGVGNNLQGNNVAFNAGLGIDLNNDGVTANDTGDADTGPNNLQNFPVISGLAGSSAITVSGTLNSAASTAYRIDFFQSDLQDPTGYGEGQRYLTSTTVTTDSGGNASFSTNVGAVAVGQYVTATATDPSGNTSEFSQARQLTGPPTVTTGFATNISADDAKTNATVNPGGLSTTVSYQYGTTTSYGSTLTGQTLTGTTSQSAQSPFNHALTAGTTYHYRAVATNSAGTTNGNDSYFVTPVPVSGTALHFDGVDDTLTVPGYANVAPTTEITIEFWQRATSIKAQSTFVMSPDNTSNRINAHVPWSDGTVYWDFGNISGAGRLTYNPGSSSIIGHWEHWAFVASQTGNFMKIYRNGVEVATKVGMSPFTRYAGDLLLGNASFGGDVDEFRIWNTARTAVQIQGNMYKSLVGQAGMSVLKFDEGVGITAALAGDNNRTATFGTGTAAPTWIPSDAPIGLPIVVTTAATNITVAGAKLNGTLDNNNLNSTAFFQYGTDTSYGTQTTSVVVNADTNVRNEFATVTGLSAGTVYHYRIGATNAKGTMYGADMTFTTLPGPFTLAEASKALGIAGGLVTATAADKTRLDIEPATPNGKIDVADAVRIVRKVAGTDTPNP